MRIARVERVGFTLVELLVVIGIMAVLLALITPGVFRALEAAHRTTCTNHLRTLGQAVFSYAYDNDSRLPGPCWMQIPVTVPDQAVSPNSHAPLNRHLFNYLTVQSIPDGNDVFVPVATCPSTLRRWPETVSPFRIAPDSPFGRRGSDGNFSATLRLETAQRHFGKSLQDIFAVYDWDQGDYGPIHGGGRNYLFLDGHVETIKGTHAVVTDRSQLQ